MSYERIGALETGMTDQPHLKSGADEKPFGMMTPRALLVATCGWKE
jgi:hypothetical protein